LNATEPELPSAAQAAVPFANAFVAEPEGRADGAVAATLKDAGVPDQEALSAPELKAKPEAKIEVSTPTDMDPSTGVAREAVAPTNITPNAMRGSMRWLKQ